MSNKNKDVYVLIEKKWGLPNQPCEILRNNVAVFFWIQDLHSKVHMISLVLPPYKYLSEHRTPQREMEKRPTTKRGKHQKKNGLRPFHMSSILFTHLLTGHKKKVSHQGERELTSTKFPLLKGD